MESMGTVIAFDIIHPMIESYIRQVLTTRWTPKTVDLILTEITKDSKSITVLCDMNIYKKCKFTYHQYLFVYRLILSKVIEILDCFLKDNQEPFIKPNKDIYSGYPLMLFSLKEIGLIRRKFMIQILEREITFDEIPNLAGDPKTMINNWEKVRSNYLNFQGDIETLFTINGSKEFKIPARLLFFLEETDKILENQRLQYSPIKINKIQLKGNTLLYKNQKIIFKKDGVRLKIINLFVKNSNGISSKEIRNKLEMSYELFKTNIRQINNRLKDINLKIRYDKNKKIYLLTTT